jgi:hypothetical protein
MTTPAQREAVARKLDEMLKRVLAGGLVLWCSDAADEIIAAYEAAAPKDELKITVARRQRPPFIYEDPLMPNPPKEPA